MSSDISRPIVEHFTAQSRDITPPAACDAVCLVHAPVSQDPEVTNRCWDILSDQEQQRARRFTAKYDRSHFLQRRVFRRFCAAAALGAREPLSRIIFQETEKGRPYLAEVPELRFSFSSCRSGFLGAWSKTHGLGVALAATRGQIEPVTLADRFFTRTEARSIARTDHGMRLWTFLRLWTLKEAALKSIGEGLPYGLDAFEFELEPIQHFSLNPAHSVRTDLDPLREQPGLLQSGYVLG